MAVDNKRKKADDDEMEALYKRLAHYIDTMATTSTGAATTTNGYSENTKLKFAINAEVRSLYNKYNDLKQDYRRCVDMLKELKMHNIATHTDLSNQITKSELTIDDLKRSVSEKNKELKKYINDINNKTNVIQQQHEQLHELQMKENEYKLTIEDLNNRLRKQHNESSESISNIKRRLNKEIDHLRDELSTIKNENTKLQKLIDNDDVNVVMERSLRRRVRKSEEALLKERETNKRLNAQWEKIIAERVEEIHAATDEKVKKYQVVIKRLQSELKALRSIFA